jgi:hypothetical protein
MQVKVTGIPWYRREDYERLRNMFTDGSKLPATYDDWLAAAQGIHDKLTDEGQVVEKAYIDPGSFPEWCRANGKALDVGGRMAYGNECAANRYRAR